MDSGCKAPSPSLRLIRPWFVLSHPNCKWSKWSCSPCLRPRPFGHGVSYSSFVKRCLAELHKVATAIQSGSIIEHSLSSTLVFGNYQCRQDAWLLSLASYQELGFATPVIGTGAHVNSKRPAIKKLRLLVLLTLFHSFHILAASFSISFPFFLVLCQVAFPAICQARRVHWTSSALACHMDRARHRVLDLRGPQVAEPKKLRVQDARLVNRMLALQTFLG